MDWPKSRPTVRVVNSVALELARRHVRVVGCLSRNEYIAVSRSNDIVINKWCSTER